MSSSRLHTSKQEKDVPFHVLAYEQVAANLRKNGNIESLHQPYTQSHGGMDEAFNYNSKSNWELLPHMTYSSQKLNNTSHKELSEDQKNHRETGYGASRTSEKKPVNTANSNKKNKNNLLSTSASFEGNVNSFAGPSYSDLDALNIPLSHLTLQGIDQLEVLSDGDEYSSDNIDSELEVDDDLGIGSMVEVIIKEVARSGVIRWIGTIPGDKHEARLVAGVEMEDLEDGLSDGTFCGKRYFSCRPGKALFVPLRMCIKDSRFLESLTSNPRASLAFGKIDCHPVCGSVSPPSNSEEVKAMFGRNKGIQGHQNSCYLDATLFSMFAFTSVFDNLLFRPPTDTDIKEYIDVQQVLRDEIVNPLRSHMFVRADRIMKLRTMLDNLSSVRGLTTEEKDPEEFLQSLLAQILKAEPFLQLSSGHEAYHYQLFVDKDEKLDLPSVQTLFEQSFLASDIKLKQVPSCLIIQMPRFGKDYKMYPRILPSVVLDVTDVIENSPRQCIICGKLAEYECKQCFGHCGSSGLESISFCVKCMDKVHCHKKRGTHSSAHKLKIPSEFQMLADHCGVIPRIYMELFAVVCIETSHYVTFTRCGSGANATWCFFDSMADRKGEQHGYNIPAVIECGDLMQWLDEKGNNPLNVTADKALPELHRRLICDSYMCFYQSQKVMMYR